MNYTLHQLRVFLKVVENQSITRASEELFLTQPAVSIQLKKFQDQFAVPLTEIIGRQLFVTEFGHEIAKTAERILQEIEAINYQTKAYQNMLAGKLKVSVASTGKYVMPFFLSEFVQQHRGVDLVMDVTNKTRVVRSLERNEVDFCLVSRLPEKLKVERLELISNKLYLVGSPGILADHKGSVKQLLQKVPMVFREAGSATRRAMESYVEKHQLPVFKRIELTSNEAAKQAVIAGLGLSIMPLIGLRNELDNKDLQIIPQRSLPMVTHWNLIWLKDKKLSPVAKAYLEHLKSERLSISKKYFDWYEHFK